MSRTNAIRSWGRVVRADHVLARPHSLGDVGAAFDAAKARDLTILGHGLGRSYGDSNLNPDNILLATTALNRFISFDRETGVLRAEAGVSLDEVLRVAVPAGYFIHTTPGTRYVTLAGAIANDVHGKNHHSAGSFGENVRAFGLVRSDGAECAVDPETAPEQFAATIGGLGLTGLITWVEIQLVPIAAAYIDQTLIPFSHVDGFFDIASTAADTFEHTVAWIDCTARGAQLGRGVFSAGKWAATGDLIAHQNGGPTLPVDLPGQALNPLTLKAFNTLYRWRQTSKPAVSRSHYSSFFYPLDSIGNWNRAYGSKGFFQYQCVVPHSTARDAIPALLERIARANEGSMLAVLKSFGDKPGRGLLSFPMPGATLALDFRNRGAATLALMADLDTIVCDAGGRLYPAKDGRISASVFQAGYPDWQALESLRDPLISSSFWRRVTNS
ncbi:FAD-binding oxidoreductase [uncultured Maricaulis sp.]|uniref:FAD-binding oxidoreductase n=1 Tax=uncultured Maricaulis sp. TaxID=174710 RepID=UPI0030DD36ED